MAFKAGGRGFLHLSAESFAEPTWREAVIVSVDGEWVKTLVHSRRVRGFPAVSTGARRRSLLPGRSQRSPALAWGPRDQDALGSGSKSFGRGSQADVGLH